MYSSHLSGGVTELAESTGLENRRGATHRGFESHPLRPIIYFISYLSISYGVK